MDRMELGTLGDGSGHRRGKSRWSIARLELNLQQPCLCKIQKTRTNTHPADSPVSIRHKHTPSRQPCLSKTQTHSAGSLSGSPILPLTTGHKSPYISALTALMVRFWAFFVFLFFNFTLYWGGCILWRGCPVLFRDQVSRQNWGPCPRIHTLQRCQPSLWRLHPYQ